ncbi:homoserine O-acetyltransferase [Peribacillus sp. NPDC097295]|uniref:alpha/beta fold hydrolase n=1 Tax=Peribacillus sp. NPDC097295 TaxID=3364402 RepID=UPI00382FE99B
MNLVKKQSFRIDRFTFEDGKSIPVELGYETYGNLNEDKSNVILVNHYFSGSSHAAGKYNPDETASGYWDGLIGPGKAVNTDKYFVISTDNIANVQAKNPKVITTGPRTINPETGRKYGSDFPAFTYRDVVKIQHEFLTKQLGIEKLYAVMGASAGGFMSFYWAILYPEMVERMVGVITNPQNPVHTSFNVCQHAMRVLELDPKWQGGNYEDGNEPEESLRLAVQMMNVGAYTPEFFEETYKRDSTETGTYKDITIKTAYENQLYEAIKVGSALVDASHWYYTSRAVMMHDITYGDQSFEDALNKISAKVLLVSSTSDILQPTIYNRQTIDIMNTQGKDAELFEIESKKGHMAGIFDTHLFSDKISGFLKD